MFFKFLFPSLLVALLFLFLFENCNSPYTYKKRGFFKISFPKKEYQAFNLPGFPYSFEFPKYASIIKDTSFFDERPENPWWVNIDVPTFNGKVYISYKDLNQFSLDSLIAQCYKMAYYKHTDIASGITDSVMHVKNKVNGMYFTLLGNTATANQFFVTDSVSHFLRGALYFNNSPNEDSLQVVNQFLKQDLLHLINTIQWR